MSQNCLSDSKAESLFLQWLQLAELKVWCLLMMMFVASVVHCGSFLFWSMPAVSSHITGLCRCLLWSC